jgi:hypothetical protein
MNEPISSIGAHLKYGKSSEAVTTQLYSITSLPDLGGAPERIDVTTLAHKVSHSMPGVQQLDALEFNGLMGKFGPEEGPTTDEFAALKALDNKTLHYFEIGFSDGSKFKFAGYPTAYATGVEVNAAAGYTLSVALNSEITFTPAG